MCGYAGSFRQELSTMCNHLVPALSEHEDIVGCYVFGSVARGDAGNMSDVDLAVLLELTSDSNLFTRRLQILRTIAEMLGTDRVDLIVLNDAPVALAYKILKEGQLIYERPGARAARVDFESRTYLWYFDFRRIECRMRRAMRRRIKEARFGG